MTNPTQEEWDLRSDLEDHHYDEWREEEAWEEENESSNR